MTSIRNSYYLLHILHFGLIPIIIKNLNIYSSLIFHKREKFD